MESSKQSVTEFPFETLTEEQKEMLIQSALAPWHLDEQQRLHWIMRRLEELENPPKECMSLAYYMSHEFFLEDYEQLLRDFQKKEGKHTTYYDEGKGTVIKVSKVEPGYMAAAPVAFHRLDDMP